MGRLDRSSRRETRNRSIKPNMDQAVDGMKLTLKGVKEVFTGGAQVAEPTTYTDDAAWPPEFCKTIDSPKFTVITKTEDWEERQYDASNWVSTSMEAIHLNDVYLKMFNKLFDYISGHNQKEEKIAMTAPVLLSITPGEGPACESSFTMSFFISPKITEAPAPKEETVFLSTMPEQRAYIRSFGGFAKNEDFIKNAAALAAALPDTVKYNKDMYYTGGYNSPFTLFNRHNEVWFIGL